MRNSKEILGDPIPVRFSKKDRTQINKRRRAISESAFVRLSVKAILSRPDAYEMLRAIQEQEAMGATS